MNAFTNFFLKQKKILIILFLVAASVLFFILRSENLARLSLWMDEGFYYLAAEKILDYGYPLYPSGHILFKGILYSYLLGLISFVFGLSELNLRMFSVLASVAIIPLLYLFAKKFVTTWMALISVIILLFSTWETEYSRTVLYFAPLQLVYLLSLYFFYKGFFENLKKYKILSFLFFVLAPFVHQLAMGLWFCYVALFLIKGSKRFLKKDVLLPFLLTTVVYFLMQLHEILFWKVGYVYTKTGTGFQEIVNYFFSGFSLAYFKEILRSFPHMGLLVFFGFFVFVGEFSIKKLKSEADFSLENWYFLNLCLFFPLLFLGFFRTHIQPRYLFQLRPVLILLFLIVAWKLSQIVVDLLGSPFGLRKREAPLARFLSVALFVVTIFFFTDQAGFGKIQKIIHRNYKDRISTDIITRSGRFEHYDHRGVGEYVRHYLEKNDLVIAIHVVFQYIYAGQVDYWLWSGGPGTWDAWEKTREGWKDFYVGAKWINNLVDLKRVIEENPERRIFLITCPSILRIDHISADIASFIKGNQDKLVFRGKDEMSEVYLWHDREKKFTQESHALEAEWIPTHFGRVVYEGSASKKASFFWEGKKKKELITFSLPSSYPEGYYELVLRMKTDDNSQKENILGLTVFSERRKQVVLSHFFSGSDFKKTNEYQDFEFKIFLPKEDVARLKLLSMGGGRLWLDYFDLIPIKENPDERDKGQ